MTRRCWQHAARYLGMTPALYLARASHLDLALANAAARQWYTFQAPNAVLNDHALAGLLGVAKFMGFRQLAALRLLRREK